MNHMTRRKRIIGPAALVLIAGAASLAVAQNHGGGHQAGHQTGQGNGKPPSHAAGHQPGHQQPGHQQSGNQQPGHQATSAGAHQEDERMVQQILREIQQFAGRPLTVKEIQQSRQAIEARNAAIRAAHEQFHQDIAKVLQIPAHKLPGHGRGHQPTHPPGHDTGHDTAHGDNHQPGASHHEGTDHHKGGQQPNQHRNQR